MRNLDKTPFPAALDDKKKAEVTRKLYSSVLDSNSALSKDFKGVELDTLSASEKTALAEEHLISPQMLEGKGHSVLINKNRTMSIMFMEEDHIRLQVIMGGYHLDEAYDAADKVDDVIEESLTYAFDEKFGYLTACPTNASGACYDRKHIACSAIHIGRGRCGARPLRRGHQCRRMYVSDLQSDNDGSYGKGDNRKAQDRCQQAVRHGEAGAGNA